MVTYVFRIKFIVAKTFYNINYVNYLICVKEDINVCEINTQKCEINTVCEINVQKLTSERNMMRIFIYLVCCK